MAKSHGIAVSVLRGTDLCENNLLLLADVPSLLEVPWYVLQQQMGARRDADGIDNGRRSGFKRPFQGHPKSFLPRGIRLYLSAKLVDK